MKTSPGATPKAKAKALRIENILVPIDFSEMSIGAITATHGYTGFQHVMIGSTAEQVVRRATCPVLVVPSHPELRVGQIAKQTAARRPAPRSTAAPVLRKGSVLSGQPRSSGRSPYKIGRRRQAKKYREPTAPWHRSLTNTHKEQDL